MNDRADIWVVYGVAKEARESRLVISFELAVRVMSPSTSGRCSNASIPRNSVRESGGRGRSDARIRNNAHAAR